ncbi:MAG: hypothetical protein WBL05_07180 [Brooklawnia sp.]|uniref:hypothetical protein n=1 Tax=Brooklawnia sp. TaxID=2699740 RepID=UPI003C756850
MLDVVPVDELLREGQIGLGRFVGFEHPSLVGMRRIQRILEGAVDEVERHLVVEVDARLHQQVLEAQLSQLVTFDELETDRISAVLGLGHILGSSTLRWG